MKFLAFPVVLISLTMLARSGGSEKISCIYIAGFENKSDYHEKGNQLEKKLLCTIKEILKEKGLQVKNDKKDCDYLLEGTVLLFSLEKNNEIIPFVNRWRNVVTALVQVRIKLSDSKNRHVILDTKELSELTRKGKERVDFNVEKETLDEMELNETIRFDTGFDDSLIGRCTRTALERLSDKVVAAICEYRQGK